MPEGYSSSSLLVIRNSGPRNVKLLVKSLDTFQKNFFPASVTALHHLGDRRPSSEKEGHPILPFGPAAIGSRRTLDWVRRPWIHFPEELVSRQGPRPDSPRSFLCGVAGHPAPRLLGISELAQAVHDPARRCRISPIRIRRASRLSLQCIYSCAV
jgi:hypothetical protein